MLRATHLRREIQTLLVKLGDKHPSFIGSSNWIGAIELSYILNEYLGVTSKVGGGCGGGFVFVCVCVCVCVCV